MGESHFSSPRASAARPRPSAGRRHTCSPTGSPAPPWMLAGLREAGTVGEWLRTLAAAAQELAAEPHAGREPVGDGLAGAGGTDGMPFEPLELRAAAAAASTLTELAELASIPGWGSPSRSDAL